MAITNAQQFKQLVNPPMKGNKRPGYRGEAAAASDAAAGRDAGRSDTGSASGRGDGLDSSGPTRNPMAQFGFTPKEKDIIQAIGEREMERRNEKIGLGDRINFPNFFPTVKAGLNLIKTKRGNEFAAGFNRSLRDLNEEDEDTGNGGDGQSIFLPPMIDEAPSITDQKPKLTELQQLIEDTPSYRFAAEGGIMNNDVVGGEFDFESARQMYGLGKLVKKVTRTVKKIAKSPIGKAALLYAGGSYLSGMGAFGNLKGAGFLSKAKLFGTPGYFNIGSALHGTGTGKAIASTPGFLGKLGLTKGAGSMALTGKGLTAAIGIPSILAGLMTPKEEDEDEDQTAYRGESLDIADIRSRPRDFLAPRFLAEGGSTEKEPVAKKTMPLIDMDGKEKDYRETGGFVDIGRMEKADDVPARLSKNEFVFTADAVRNAGDGSVDKGAEVMYNMMKNLEAGGDVSEESQGLEGARKMFQTSQRLEEVL